MSVSSKPTTAMSSGHRNPTASIARIADQAIPSDAAKTASKVTPDVIAAVGHFRAGVQLSLGTAYLVRNFVLGEPPILPAEPFAVGRAAREPVRTAFRS